MRTAFLTSVLPSKIAAYWRARASQWQQARIPAGKHRLNARSVFILPTKQGGYLALFLVAMLLACINYNLSLGYMLTFFVFSVGLGAMSRTHQNLLGLECVLLAPAQADTPCFAGSSAVITFELCNTTGLDKQAIVIDFMLHPSMTPPSSAPPIQDLGLALEAGKTAQSQRFLASTRRGLHAVPPIKISSTYPLGLWRAWSYVFHPSVQTHGLWVFPAPRTPLPLMPSLASYGAATAARAVEFSTSGDAVSHIEAADTAPARSIHWPSVAKGQLAQRVLENEAPVSTPVQLDLKGCTVSGIEAQLEQLCAGVLHCQSHRIPFVLALGAQRIPSQGEARCDTAHTAACLQALALYE